MKTVNKVLSALLAVLMIGSVLTVFTGAIKLYDEDGIAEGAPKYSGEADYEVTIDKYVDGSKYATPQEKLADMTMMWERYGYQLWSDEITGEVATVKVSTGEILFSNPWDVSSASYTSKTQGKASATTSPAVKKELLSQIVINYLDNNSGKTFYSSIESAARNQIKVEYIKNGIRVEYSIGREETRMLVPKLIRKERFDTMILKPMREYYMEDKTITISDGTVKDEDGNTITKNYVDKKEDVTATIKYNPIDYPGIVVGETYSFYDLLLMKKPNFNMSGGIDLNEDKFEVKKVGAYYTLKDATTASSDREQAEIIAAFPITSKMAVYVFDPGASTNEMTLVERYIKDYAPSYTYEELDRDHEETEYVGQDKSPALFKLALEYTLDESGVVVRLPANGIRYDESLYQLKSIQMLPYMGAGENDGDWSDGGDGYTFFPDGSGALFDFQQLNGITTTINGKVYGSDYAYHTITATHQESVRYPVFGIVENWEGNKTDYTNVVKEATYNSDGTVKTAAVYGTKKVKEDHGFVAIIEEGDALAELSTANMGTKSIYNTVKMIFYPRPMDTYNMADAISVGSNKEVPVVSSRKYVGSYKVRYLMLSDDNLAEENHLASYYECSWMGMAVAYRDYLERNNILTRLTDSDVEDDIPLYIQTFGTLMTTEKILSIPVDVMTPLTSFDNIKTMYSELSTAIKKKMDLLVESGNAVGTTQTSASKFSNINFKLTGYANGGMFSVMPYNLNWESAVGGAGGFDKLVEYAKEEGFGIFPDFDFVYANNLDVFDGVDLKRDAVKTIDNRYTTRRQWSATTQSYIGYYSFAISPASFERFVTKLSINYLKYNPIGISVSTLGTDLNSDFDEEDPLNREDSKEYTIDALKQLSLLRNDDGDSIKIMSDGANAYTWRYLDYIVNMPLNSSRYNKSSNAVPFIGVVLHGYLQYAGTPINEEGDIEYAFLKAIENGAGLYFTLSYQNTQKLKENKRLSDYYSIRYDIWSEDVVSLYTKLNDLLCDLQTKLIIDHDLLVGERIPDEDEIEDDKAAEEEAKKLEEATAAAEAAKKALAEALELRKTPTNQATVAANALKNIADQIITISKYTAMINETYVTDCAAIIKAANAAQTAAETAQKTAYYADAYDAGLEAAKTSILNSITIAATEIADTILESVISGADETKKAEILAAVNAAQGKVVNAAVSEGALVAVEKALNTEPTYTSSADANANAVIEAKAVVSAVSSAVATAGAKAITEAPAAYKSIVESVVSAVVEGILESFTQNVATSAITAATTAYNSSVTATQKKINSAATAIVNEYNAYEAAKAAGIAVADIDNAVALKRAYEEASQAVNAVTAYKTAYTRAASTYVNSMKSYYKAIGNIYAELAGTNSTLKTSLAAINDYELAEIEAQIYELTASIENTTSNQTTATSKRTTANDKKAAVDKLTAEQSAAAKVITDKVDAMIQAAMTDYSAEYNKLVGYINAYYDDLNEVYQKAAADKSDDVKAAISAINESSRWTAILDAADTFNTCNGSFAGSKAKATASAALVTAKAAVTALVAANKTAAEAVIKAADISKVDKKDYDSAALLQTAAEAFAAYETAKADRDAAVDGYKEYAAKIEALNEAKTAADTANKAETIALNKTAAATANTAAATAYKAVAANDEIKDASGITALIDNITKNQNNLNTAKAAYEAAKAIAESSFGATSTEKAALVTKEAAYKAAQTALTTAEDDFDSARNASEHKTEFDAVVTAYRAKLKADSEATLITTLTTAVGSRISNTYGLQFELDIAVNETAKYNLLNNEFTTKSADYKTYITSINNAYSRIESALSTAKIALENAEKATAALKEKYEASKNNAEATDLEKRSAEQFYNSAVENVGKIKDIIAELNTKYGEMSALVNDKTILEAKVLLFGNANITTNNTTANKDIVTVNDALDSSNASLEAISEAWDDIHNAADIYTKAMDAIKAINAKFEGKTLSNMTDAELLEYRVELTYQNYRILIARNTINDAQTVITTENSNFRKNFTALRSMTSIEASVISAETEAANAKKLYELLSADSTADATKVADAKAANEKFSTIASTLRASYTEIQNKYKALCEKALEANLIDATNTLVTNTAVTEFVDKLFNGDKDDTTVTETTKYTCNDGSIVAITYGGKDGNDNLAYRTFLLNYNSFAVTVTYNGVSYTVPGYGYKVINY